MRISRQKHPHYRVIADMYQAKLIFLLDQALVSLLYNLELYLHTSQARASTLGVTQERASMFSG